jgi:Protein tyrosine and serine/threonine kinase
VIAEVTRQADRHFTAALVLRVRFALLVRRTRAGEGRADEEGREQATKGAVKHGGVGLSHAPQPGCTSAPSPQHAFFLSGYGRIERRGAVFAPEAPRTSAMRWPGQRPRRGSLAPLFSLALLGSCVTALSPVELGVLADVYNSTGGAYWLNSSGWTSSGVTCSAFGVVCTPAGALAELHLSANNLGGTFPRSVCSASALAVLDVSHNLISGPLPSLSGCNTLTTALLGFNVFRGTIPTSLGALPLLSRLDLTSLFITGDVPASFAVNTTRWVGPAKGLSLGATLLNGSTLPPALCQFVCSWTAAFTCPSGISAVCGSQAANVTCMAQQCAYNACPVVLQDSALASMARSCSTPSLSASCSTCLPSLVLFFIQLGVIDVGGIVGCIQLYAPALLAAGCSASALAMLPQCSLTLPASISAVQCPSALPSDQLVVLAQGCSNVNEACTTCGQTAVQVFQNVGLISSTDSLFRQYLLSVSCTSQIIGPLYNAGLPPSVLFAATGCAGSLQVPLTVTAVASLDGTSTIFFSSAAVISSVATALGVGAQIVSVVDAVDFVPAAPLAGAGCNITFKVYPTTVAQQTALITALASRSAASAFLTGLRTNGMAVTAARLSLVSAVSDVSPAASSPASVTVSSGTIAGAVVGSAVGAALVVVVAVLAYRWRFSPSSVSVLPSSSSDTKSSGSGGSDENKGFAWTAFVSTAEEVQLGDLIGKGGSGRVYDALWRGSHVAVKVFYVGLHPVINAKETGRLVSADVPEGASIAWPSLPTGLTDTVVSSADGDFVKEVAMLGQLRHPNILAIYALVREPAMLVMELGTRGSLRNFMRSADYTDLGWPGKFRILAGVAAGVEFLHSQTPPIVHLDLKADNVS